MITFDEYKQRISIIQVAVNLGYQHDRSKGLAQPSFVLTDGVNNIIDRIYIKNPNNSGKQGYWRRNASTQYPNVSGDLISFVKEHINSFHCTVGARNEVDALNKALKYLAGVDPDADVKEYIANIVESAKSFNIDDYAREDNPAFVISLLERRGISREIAELFLPFIEVVQQKNSAYNYKNVGFPYRAPGDDKIRGYEIRGVGGFKGAAVGTERNAGWIADFTPQDNTARFVIFAESAFDLMAFYQLNKGRFDIYETVFFSTGGAFSNEQISKMLLYYDNASPIFCFDNDPQGRMFDARALALKYNKQMRASVSGDIIKFSIDGKSFELSTDFTISEFEKKAGIKRLPKDLYYMKAPEGCKDWNDAIHISKDKEEEVQNSRYDCNINMKRRADGGY